MLLMWAVKIKRLLALPCDMTLMSTGTGRKRVHILFFSFSLFSPSKAKRTRALVFYDLF